MVAKHAFILSEGRGGCRHDLCRSIIPTTKSGCCPRVVLRIFKTSCSDYGDVLDVVWGINAEASVVIEAGEDFEEDFDQGLEDSDL